MRLAAIAALNCAACLALPAGALGASRDFVDRGYVYTAVDAGYLFGNGGGAKTVNLGLGFRNRHYGFEAGYVGIMATSSTLSGGYVDGYWYLPTGRSLSLFATGGASYVNANYAPAYGYISNQFGARAGVGVEWRFSADWTLRTAVRYQSTVTSAVAVTAGITVHI